MAMIRFFMSLYPIDLSIAEHTTPEAYASFNDFFTRRLQLGVRKFNTDENAFCAPVDGKVYDIGEVKQGRLMQAKDHSYSLQALLGNDAALAAKYEGGQFAAIYLAPHNYHRVHMPYAGTLREMTYVPGKLYAVNAASYQSVPGVFAANDRVICVFDTAIGPMTIILVGAMIVHGIHTAWHGLVTPGPHNTITHWRYPEANKMKIQLETGDELGYFSCGSTVIVLVGSNSVDWNTELSPDHRIELGCKIANRLV